MDNKKVIELNGIKYELTYLFADDDKELITDIACHKLIDNKVIYFGQASYDSTNKIVHCQINNRSFYGVSFEQSGIDIYKEKNDLTAVLNIAKEEILENRKEA